MSYKAMFVAIGGKSGVGKTTLVNSLILSYPSVFKRPISYTTRPRRTGENKNEYIFVTEEEIKSLYEQGWLANLDENYGYYYAMDKRKLLRDMSHNNQIVIKEIHPRYHGKIGEICGDNFISVLVKGLEREDIRGRRQEDDSFYENYPENEFDIVFFYDKSSSPQENAKYFYQKIKVYIYTHNAFPPAKSIDSKNMVGYSTVADEFTEERRITTRNFHEISTPFWNQVINQMHTGAKVLELGPGNGWLRSFFSWPLIEYSCVEISSSMKSVLCANNSLVASARCIPVKCKSVDYIVASLADPYFYPEMLCEANRILKDEALFITTLPDKEWADNLRGANNHQTSFVLDGGKKATVFSFTFSDEELQHLADNCGFSILQIDHLNGSELENEISPAITLSAEKAEKAIEDLKIVTAIIWRKRKEG